MKNLLLYQIQDFIYNAKLYVFTFVDFLFPFKAAVDIFSLYKLTWINQTKSKSNSLEFDQLRIA